MTQRSYFAGEARTGERVRLFPHPKTGVLYLEFRDLGRKVRESTHTKDWDTGKSLADEKAGELRRTVIPVERPTTLGALFDRWRPTYEAECRLRAHPPKPKHFADVDRLLARFRRFVGVDSLPLRSVADDHLTVYFSKRMAAGIESKGVHRGRPIGYAQLRAEVKLLRQVMRWGERKGYVLRDPWRDYKVGGAMAEKQYDPQRPIITTEEYHRLLTACDRFTPKTSREMCRTFLVLSYETGRRKGAVRQLRWSDIDEAAQRIRWRGGSDKNRRDRWTALSPEALLAATRWRRQRPGVGEALVFPSPHVSRVGLPVDDETLGGWWRRLEVLAGVGRRPRQGWHSVRRRAATDLQDAPLATVAALLGHSPQVLASVYQQPDAGEHRRALAGRRRT